MKIEAVKRVLEAASYHQGPIGNGHRLVGSFDLIQATTEVEVMIRDRMALESIAIIATEMMHIPASLLQERLPMYKEVLQRLKKEMQG